MMHMYGWTYVDMCVQVQCLFLDAKPKWEHNVSLIIFLLVLQRQGLSLNLACFSLTRLEATRPGIIFLLIPISSWVRYSQDAWLITWVLGFKLQSHGCATWTLNRQAIYSLYWFFFSPKKKIKAKQNKTKKRT